LSSGSWSVLESAQSIHCGFSQAAQAASRDRNFFKKACASPHGSYVINSLMVVILIFPFNEWSQQNLPPTPNFLFFSTIEDSTPPPSYPAPLSADTSPPRQPTMLCRGLRLRAMGQWVGDSGIGLVQQLLFAADGPGSITDLFSFLETELLKEPVERHRIVGDHGVERFIAHINLRKDL
jgi:hypothetical protein